MTNLVSPGVETSIIDDSLFVPNAASLVPLFFVATQDEKIRSNGEEAAGTFEHSVVRSITSIRQSINTYGEPVFLSDAAGNQNHGDARNEYGLFALNQYLGIGNAAFVVRANVNVNDNIEDIQDQWNQKSSEANTVIQNVVQNYIANINAANGLTQPGLSVINASPMQTEADFPGFVGGSGYALGDAVQLSNSAMILVTDVDVAGAITAFTVTAIGSFVTVGQTLVAIVSGAVAGTGFSLTLAPANLQEARQGVTAEELQTLVRDSTNFIFDDVVGTFAFRNLEEDFYAAKGEVGQPDAFPIFPNGFDLPAGPDLFYGFDGAVARGTPSDPAIGWTPAEAGALFSEQATNFQFTQTFLVRTSLGANDAARRVTIVQALQAAINSNTDVRAESFQFNVVACPGYPEVVDELLALSADQQSEVLVVADPPANRSPDGITNPTNGWAVTTERQNSTNVAYYYPWCLAANLDGANVLAAPSGTAIRQIAFSDNVSFLWLAPAGTTRGLVTGVTDVGFAEGVVGGATNFRPVALNQGQRDALYQDTPSGRINPIVFQPGRGIAIMGQKTSAPNPSALDRINVVRLVMHVRRQLRLSSVSFLFEPNDQRTRDNVKGLADNFLGTIMTNRGIIDFLTVCDETNNTPDVVGRSELILDVLIRPTLAVEFISIPIRVVTQGAEI